MNMTTADLIAETISQHIANPKVISYAATKLNEVQGRFVASNRAYNFILTPKGVSYSPAGQGDSLLFSGLYLERLDAARKPKIGNDKCNAGISYQCGKICLGNRRKCHKGVRDVNDARRIASILESTNEKLKGSLEGSDKAIARGKALFEARGNRGKNGKAAKEKIKAKPIEMSDLGTAEVASNNTQIKPIGKFLVASKADLDHFNKHPKKLEWTTYNGDKAISAKAIYNSKNYAVDANGQRFQVAHKDMLGQLDEIKKSGGKITPFKADDLLLYGVAKHKKAT